MIRKAIINWLQRPNVIAARLHRIAPSDINSRARAAIGKLQAHGFEAYIVGGAVRDLLVGEKPKDFDIATAATPAQVRRLFGNSRIIGRRFKIVHLYFRQKYGSEIIEVSTFRSGEDDSVCENSGRILQDNRFGAAATDASRRDFTANALFYNPQNQTIIDYTGGYADIRRKRLRLIGDPAKRLRQDPVRILRALRFAAKLDFHINRKTLEAIQPHAHLLADIPSSRLFDELVKTIQSKNCKETLAQWRRYQIAEHIFPMLAADCNFLSKVLVNSNRRFSSGKKVSVSFVVAAILWKTIEKEWQTLRAKMSPVLAMQKAIEATNFSAHHIIPKRVIARVMDIYFLYARLHIKRSKRRVMGIIGDPFIKRAISFAALAEKDGALADWWRQFVDGDGKSREKMLLADRQNK